MRPHKDDNIKDLFSSKLKNFEAGDSMSSMWDEIDQHLSETNELLASKSASRRKRVMIGTVCAGVAASLATLVLVLNTNELTIEPVLQTVDRNIVEPLGKKELTSSDLFDESNNKTSNNSTLLAQASPAVAPTRQRKISSKVYGDEDMPVGNVEKIEDVQSLDNEIVAASEEKLIASKKLQKEDLPDNLPYVESEMQLGEGSELRKNTSSGFSLGMKGNVGLLSSNSTDMSGGGLLSRHSRSSTFMDVLEDSKSNVKLKHRQPISAGLLVSKQLSSRLSIETGLVYTHLSSKSESTDYIETSDTQKFDYLGIPVNLNYTFWKLGKADFYGSVGVMIQKDVNGSAIYKLDMSDFADNLAFGLKQATQVTYLKETGLEKKNIHQPHVQVSAHTLVGVSFPIYRLLYVYGTVGGAYYIDANNRYETIYSDKKAQIDLNLGLKVKF